MKPFDYNKYLKNNSLLKEIDESNMEEGNLEERERPWDFLVYDLDPVLAGKLTGKAKQLGVSVKITDTGFAGQWEVRIWPNNEKTFKIVFKILEKMDLEFEETWGIFPGTFEEGKMEEGSIKEYDAEDVTVSIPNKTRADKKFFYDVVSPFLDKMTDRSDEDGENIFGKYVQSLTPKENYYVEDDKFEGVLRITLHPDLSIDLDSLQRKLDMMYSKYTKSNSGI